MVGKNSGVQAKVVAIGDPANLIEAVDGRRYGASAGVEDDARRGDGLVAARQLVVSQQPMGRDRPGRWRTVG